MALSLGELLAGAGRIGAVAEEQSQQMRNYERDRLALDETRRLEALRREMLNAPMPTQAPAFDFGAGMPIESIAPAQAPVAPAPTPAVSDGITALDPNSPQARALYQQRFERLRAEQSKAAGVPLAVEGAPSRAGVTPAPGITQVNPQGSRFTQWYQGNTAQNQVTAQREGIQRSLITGEYGGPGSAPIRNIYGFFADDPNTAKSRERAGLAADWYGSDTADKYFQQNPNMLAEAQKDPIGFYEKVSKGQKALKTAVEPQPLPATKKALKYDQTKTEYDDLIMQSAQQYGVDPVIFKRLIGSESSFQADPTANRKTARGIAQIHVNNIKAGMISLQDSLNPQVAIPFAAQLFSRYLQESGGNYEQALQKYKGAVSMRGKQSMSGVINDILSGTQPAPVAPLGANQVAATDSIPNPMLPSAQAATPAPAAPAVAPTRQAQADASSFYLANPQTIPMDMQRANQMRDEMARLATMYQRAGMGTQYMEARMKVLELDNNMTYLQGMQGLQEFSLANDPRRLAAVWSQYAGVPVGIQPRSDGTFNIIVNGKKTKEGISASDISDAARSAFDQTYRQQKAETAKTMGIESFKKQLDAQVEAVKQNAQMIREATVEAIKGRNKVMEIRLGREDFEIKPIGDGTARAWVSNKAGTALGMIDANTGQFVEMDGLKIPKPPTYTGVRGAPAGVSGNVR
jgi:soluble lytic murein transglycosylase-like protein